MPISTVRESKSLTNQQLADFALQEDRAARAARKRGDYAGAIEHDRERDAITKLLQ